MKKKKRKKKKKKKWLTTWTVLLSWNQPELCVVMVAAPGMGRRES